MHGLMRTRLAPFRQYKRATAIGSERGGVNVRSSASGLSRPPIICAFSSGTPTQRNDTGYQKIKRRLGPGSFHALVVAGCTVLVLWTATASIYLGGSTLYLDAPPEQPRPSDPKPVGQDELTSDVVKWCAAFVDQQLRRSEKTCIPPAKSGISRYDMVRLASNDPVEDEHAEAVLPVPSGYWSFFGLFDGHSGRDTSAWLSDNLIPAVTGALADLYSKAVQVQKAESTPEPAPADIERTFKATFTRLDDDIVSAPLDTVFSSSSRHAAVTLLAPAYSGSCALLSFYDSHSGLLHTALTGDSRAVLGRQERDASGQPTGLYSVHALTTDQTGWNPFERERIESEHPGEEPVRNGRVMGMGVSRAFGDARYKWPRDVQDRLKRQYLGRTPLPNVKTPPYLTAEPEVTSIDVRPGDFLILASDGLWECLTNEEAIGLVGYWRDAMRSTRSPGERSRANLNMPELPVQRHSEEDDRTVRYRQWGAQKRFVTVDENAATHLLRNALGGADIDLAAALLSLRAPRSRTYRDDITIMVVFFSAEDDRREPI